MAKGVNKIILVGNLGKDPEVQQSKGGLTITKLSLAVNERKKQNGEWVDHVEWVRVTAFGKLAETAERFLEKGRQVYVEGRMQTTDYVNKAGVKTYSTEVVANEIVFLSGNGNGAAKTKPTAEELDF